MNELETLMWRSERHPRSSSTICDVMILDTTPDWERFYAAHEWGARLIPRVRQRVVEPALPVGPPAWVEDEAFDLDYHVRRVQLPRPGGMAELLSFAQNSAMAPLDRTRPLWEATLVEGLPDGKAGYFLKLHHSLTDGARRCPTTLAAAEPDPGTHAEGSGPETDDERPPTDGGVLALHELAESVQHVPAPGRRPDLAVGDGRC